MLFDIYWTTLGETTFADEVDFIYRKWNQKEVERFIKVVSTVIEKLKQNPFIGKFYSDKDIYSLVISRQSTLFYKVYPDILRIDILLLFNNTQNPEKLLKYL
ncbi:hypothetical protein CHU92_03440 [Flavobacterium cyanobacteriorum]|uniref:Plasmid stabilization protein n=1 Tax=Flavobacterium cyanobacteriorum TaxID=2022802 RepID=A0A255ZPG8_9FLAO|nr:type II toxin-antitoxin system RelE/ParE family toxin [Flavobacterium cyanobacteriorum]OYQ43403.1 hypothetical protein CHU92_03440 [Flavobacterium cyanobacteriorum]